MAYIGRGLDKISNVEKLDNLTFDGSSTSFALQKGGSSFVPSSANNILLSIDGVVQAGNFTVSGSTIDFGTAISGSSTCDFILHYGVGVITTPADGSVTTAKIQDSSVSLAKLTATGTQDATTFLRGDNTFAVPAGGTNTPAFHTTLSAGYSISDNSLTKVNFDTEVFDTDSMYDNATNYRFTPTVAGKYYCYSSLIFYGNGASTIDRTELRIRKNGSDQYTTINEFKNNPIQYHTMYGGEVIEFNGSTDYVEVYGLIDSTGGTQSLYSSAPFTSTFGAYKIIE